MIVSTGGQPHNDLLANDAPAGTRPTGWKLAAVAVVASAVLGAAAAGQFLQVDDGQGETGDVAVSLAGSLLPDDFLSSTVESVYAGEQERRATGTGSVQIELPDRQLNGRAIVKFSLSWESPDDEHNVFHQWGSVRFDLGANICEGWFGWSNFSEPLEGGGSMHLRCDDGATLVARIVETVQPEQGMAMDLRDGWYVAGSTDLILSGSEPTE